MQTIIIFIFLEMRDYNVTVEDNFDSATIFFYAFIHDSSWNRWGRIWWGYILFRKEHRDTKTLIISGHSVSRPKETNMINIFSFRLRLWQVTYWIRLIVNNEVMKVYLETYCFCSYTFWRIIFTLQSVLDIINMIFPKKYINLNYIFLFSENEKCNIQHWVESITSDAIFNVNCFFVHLIFIKISV